MKITKYFLLKSRKDFFLNFAEIYKSLLNIIQKEPFKGIVDYFSFDLKFTDKEISYSSYEEFILNKEEIDFKESIEISGNVTFKTENQTDNRLLNLLFYVNQFSDNHNLRISIESSSSELIKKTFDVIISLLPNLQIYIYDQNIEDLEKIKQKIKILILILKNLNECQLRMKAPLKDEKELQDFIFPILKSHFKDLESEFHLPRFGDIEYKPDFGIPSIKLLIECKFLRDKADIKKVQKEIHDDIIGYLKTSKQYENLIIFIYNSKNIPISDKFTKDIKGIKGVEDLIIVPGVCPL